MLREYGRQFQRGWMVFDLLVSAALFVSLLLRPEFQRSDVLVSEGGLSAVAGLGLAAAFALPVVLGRFGVYESHRREEMASVLFRLAAADAVGGLVLAALAFTFNAPVAPLFPVAFAGCLFAAQAVTRVPAFLILRALRRSGRNFRNVLIVGAGPRAAEATQSILRNPEWGLRIRGYLDNGDMGFAPHVPVEKINKFIDLPGLLRDETIDEVLVACPRTMLSELTPVVRECTMIGVPVTLLTDLFGDQLPPPRVGAFDTLRTLSFAPVHHNEIELVMKRGIDILGGLVGVALSAPIIGVAAICIKATSKGPVFFKQVRSGLNGRRFLMIKLRTMAVDADARKSELMHMNEMDGPVFKIRNDPRVTPVGRLLRKFSIDELPQFWNVLTGDMSLVGPRPPTPDEVVLYQGSDRRRLSMRPGLTCLWQVSGRNDVSFDEWMKLDLEYIDDWSLWTDLKILLRTIPEVLLGRGGQ